MVCKKNQLLGALIIGGLLIFSPSSRSQERAGVHLDFVQKASDFDVLDRQAAGGSHGGGGSINFEREAELERYIYVHLKSDLRKFVASIRPEDVALEFQDAYVSLMRNKNLIEDIASSPYIATRDFSEPECQAYLNLVNKNYPDAATAIGEPGSSICINVHSLAKKNANLEQIVGLAFHEHFHHFFPELGRELNEHAFTAYFKAVPSLWDTVENLPPLEDEYTVGETVKFHLRKQMHDSIYGWHEISTPWFLVENVGSIGERNAHIQAWAKKIEKQNQENNPRFELDYGEVKTYREEVIVSMNFKAKEKHFNYTQIFDESYLLGWIKDEHEYRRISKKQFFLNYADQRVVLVRYALKIRQSVSTYTNENYVEVQAEYLNELLSESDRLFEKITTWGLRTQKRLLVTHQYNRNHVSSTFLPAFKVATKYSESDPKEGWYPHMNPPLLVVPKFNWTGSPSYEGVINAIEFYIAELNALLFEYRRLARTVNIETSRKLIDENTRDQIVGDYLDILERVFHYQQKISFKSIANKEVKESFELEVLTKETYEQLRRGFEDF